MLCFGKRGPTQEARRDAEIDRQLRADARRASKEVKIILLGAGESGKSTVLKQMRLIHTAGFSGGERKQWRVTIYNNLLLAFRCIRDIMNEYDVKPDNPENQNYLDLFREEEDLGLEDDFPPKYRPAIEALWTDQGVQDAMTRGHEYALHDNISYYIQRLDVLFAKSYVPDDQDILRARQRTTGITETIFDTQGLTYRMFDVGGQRSERKKWMHVFDNVQVVLFLAALSGYDHALLEDRGGNQMREALMLFQSIANSKYFVNAGLVLFLNKMDLFKTKIEGGKSKVSTYFDDYQGSATDVTQAADFFAQKFKRTIKNPDKEVYIHFTNATDTSLLDKTMKSVRSMIVQKNLNSLIL